MEREREYLVTDILNEEIEQETRIWATSSKEAAEIAWADWYGLDEKMTRSHYASADLLLDDDEEGIVVDDDVSWTELIEEEEIYDDGREAIKEAIDKVIYQQGWNRDRIRKRGFTEEGGSYYWSDRETGIVLRLSDHQQPKGGGYNREMGFRCYGEADVSIDNSETGYRFDQWQEAVAKWLEKIAEEEKKMAKEE